MSRLPKLLLCAVICAPGLALAGGPGEGITLGNATLSPSVQLSLFVDTNVARANELLVESTQDADQAGYGSPGLDIRPALSLSYRSEALIGELSYNQTGRAFFTRPDYSYWNDVGLRANLDLFPNRPFGLAVRDSFSFRNYPSPYTGDTTDITTVNLGANLNSRSYNNLVVEGRYSPGSALDLNAGFFVNTDVQNYFGGDAVSEASTALPSKLELGGVLKGRWRFFPRTLMLAQLDVASGSWSNLETQIPDGAGDSLTVGKASSNLYWAFQTGIAGQITNNIQANLFLGYGGLYSEGDTTDDVSGGAGLLGQFQMIYFLQQGHSLSVGYTRRFSDAALMDYIITNSYSAGYNGLFFSNLSVGAIGRVDFSNFNSAIEGEYDSRNDFTLSANLTADYRLFPWMSVYALFRPALTTASQNAAQSESGLPFDNDKYSVSQVQFFLGVRTLY